MTMIIDGTNGLTFPDNSRQYNGYFGFKNRIINGDMRIDQRNNGASVSVAAGDRVTYGADRFSYQKSSASYGVTTQRSTVAPAGFTNSIVTTVTSAFSPAAGDFLTLGQIIEGFNVADLGWGTANAQTITISFWVRSSVTGTYTFQVGNGAINRAYATTYTISAANTWEQKTATIAGDTSGTWATDNTAGLWVRWDLGSGSNFNGTTGSWQASGYIKSASQVTWANNASATFYITGVQLEEGVVSTNFDVLPYTTQLQLCQRYYWRIDGASTFGALGSGYAVSTTRARIYIDHPLTMRAAPTYSYGGTVNVDTAGGAPTVTSIVTSYASPLKSFVDFGVSSGLVGGQGVALYTQSGGASNYVDATSEL